MFIFIRLVRRCSEINPHRYHMVNCFAVFCVIVLTLRLICFLSCKMSIKWYWTSGVRIDVSKHVRCWNTVVDATHLSVCSERARQVHPPVPCACRAPKSEFEFSIFSFFIVYFLKPESECGSAYLF